MLGDVGEWSSVSEWQWKKKKRPGLETQLPIIDKDIASVNYWLDDLDKCLKKNKVRDKHFICGNHDTWLDAFAEAQVGEHASFDGYRFKNAVKLKERDWQFHPVGDYLKIGPLYFYHGDLYGGPHHAMTHLVKMGCNVIYAHHHDYQLNYISHIDDPKMACSLGCLKHMSHAKNKWLKGRKTNWTHCFGIVDFFDGLFKLEVCTIINGKTTLWGNKING